MKKTIFLFFVCMLLLLNFLHAESGLTATPYGYVKLDAIYETGRASHGNYILWAVDPGESDGLFYMTANETRLGLKIEGLHFGKFKGYGQVEIDFYGGGAENKALNFMRHAFLEITNGNFFIKAGQNWDIIAPLNPVTLNYTVNWACGNIGYRRPQLSLRKDFAFNKNLFSIQAGIFRNISQDYDGDGIDDGIASASPIYEGRISTKLNFGQSALQLGISGHFGKTGGTIDYSTHSINVDLSFDLSPRIKLIGEYFNGKNLGMFLGGIVQEVSNNTEIRAKGFFVNLIASITDSLQLSVAYGMDDPDDRDLSPGNRSKNSSYFASFRYSLSPQLKLGLEFSNWTTDYLDQETQKTFRIQHSWILYF
jgi:hypothetical protein